MASRDNTQPGGGGGDPNDGFRMAVAAFALFWIFLEIHRATREWFEDLFYERYGFSVTDSQALAWVALILLCIVIYQFIKSISPFILVPFVLLFELAMSRLPFLL